MILESLISYAQANGLGDPDFEKATLHWIIALDRDGILHATASEKMQPIRRFRKKVARAFTSPNEMNHGGKAHFLIDSLDRALGFTVDPGSSLPKSRENSPRYFRELIAAASEACATARPYLSAVGKFLDSSNQVVHAIDILRDMQAAPVELISFEVDGVPVWEQPEIQEHWRTRRAALASAKKRPMRVSMATGRMSPTVLTSEKIRGIPGGLSTGTNLIACDKPSFSSYGLKQAQNSPLDSDSEVKLRGALNDLVEKGIRLGDTIVVFWASNGPSAISDSQDEAELIRQWFQAPLTGKRPPPLPERRNCFGLCLSGFGARIIIRDWLNTTVSKVISSIQRWAEDNAITSVTGTDLHPAPTLDQILHSLVRSDFRELPLTIPMEIYKAAILGSPIPHRAFTAALYRQRLDSRPNPVRTGFIRACLLRSLARMDPNQNPKIPVALDLAVRDPAYLCGRLFAVFDRAQFLALGSLNAPMAARFYAGASTTPALVMGRLFRVVQYYLTHVRAAVAIGIRKDIEEIVAGLGSQFPQFFDTEAQGRFALGYYHQKAEYRRRKAERDKNREIGSEDAEPIDDTASS